MECMVFLECGFKNCFHDILEYITLMYSIIDYFFILNYLALAYLFN